MSETQQSPDLQEILKQEYPLKWHKFLIYFSLWAGAILNAYNGVNMLSGAVYEGNRDLVYATFPSLPSLDLLYGALLLVVAVYTILTRFSLAKYQKKAPKMLLLLYVLSLFFTLSYSLLTSLVTKIPLSNFLSLQVISSLVSSVVMLFANKVYYEKRAALFVN